MAVPGRSDVYADESDPDVGTAVVFDLDDGNWTNNPTVFEVNTLPPGFTIDGDPGTNRGLNLGGQTESQMEYTIFVRGVNADGAGEWVPLQWSVAQVDVTVRTLYGLPIDYPAAAQNPAAAAVIFVQSVGLSPSGSVGLMYVNDIGVSNGISMDGTASKYGADIRGGQIILNGTAVTFLRASHPGWEVIIDTSG